jgi:hypothetical protein
LHCSCRNRLIYYSILYPICQVFFSNKSKRNLLL